MLETECKLDLKKNNNNTYSVRFMMWHTVSSLRTRITKLSLKLKNKNE